MASNIKRSTGNQQASRVQQYVDGQLEKTRRQVKWNDLIVACLTWAAAVAAFLLALALIDAWVVPFSTMGRWIAWATLVLGSLAWLVLAIVPLFLRKINLDYAAHMIEQATPDVKNSVLNYSLLRKPDQSVNVAVMDAVSRQAAQKLNSIPSDNTIDRSHLIRVGFILVGLMVFAVAYKLMSPRDPLQSVQRILFPGHSLAKPASVQISQVTPGDCQVFFGDSLQVSAKIKGPHRPEDVRLIVSSDDGQITDAATPMTVDESGRIYQGLVSPGNGGIQQALRYRIEARDGVTPEYRIEVKANPSIAVETVELTPPAYTRLPKTTLTGRGDIEAIEGTEAMIFAAANLPIQVAYIELLNAVPGDDPQNPNATVMKPAAPPIEMRLLPENRAAGRFNVTLNSTRTRPRATHYQIRFVGTNNERNETPNVYPIRVIPDLAPEIRVIEPRSRETDVASNGKLAILIEANDLDFAIDSVVLNIDHQGRQLVRQSLELKTDNGNQRVSGRFLFEPTRYRLQPGDQVVFQAVASDNRISIKSLAPDPNVSQTDNFTLTIIEPSSEPDRQPADDGGEETDPNDNSDQDSQDDGGDSADNNSTGDEGQSRDDPSNDSSQDGTSDPDSGEPSDPSSKNETGDEGSDPEDGNSSNDEGGNQGSESSNQPPENGNQNQQDNSEGSGQEQEGSGADQNQTGNQEQSDAAGRNESRNEGVSDQGDPQGSSDGGGSEGGAEGSQGGGDSNDPSGTSSGGSPGDSQEQGPAGTNQDDPNARAADQPNTGGANGSDANGGAQSDPGDAGSDQQGTRDNSLTDGRRERLPKDAHDGEKFEKLDELLKDQPPSDPSSKQKGDRQNGDRQNDEPQDNSDQQQGNQQQGDPSGSGNQQQDDQTQGNQPQDGSTGDPSTGQQPNEQQGSPSDSQNNQPSQQPGDSQNSSDSQGSQSSKGAQGDSQQSESSGGAGQPSGGQGQSSENAGSPPTGGGQPSAGGTAQGSSDPQGGSDGQSGSDQAAGAQGQEPSETANNDGNGQTGQPNEGAATTGQQGSGDGSDQPSNEQFEKEQANLEHAKKSTDLVLNKLKDQVDNPDPDLLDKMNWTEQDLREFLDRWQRMKQSAQTGDPNAQQQYEEAIKSLGLRPDGNSRTSKNRDADASGLNQDSSVIEPPADLAPDFNEFLRDRNRVR